MSTKKELGKKRYDKQQARVGQQKTRDGRTRPSDISSRRITDGIPAQHDKRYRLPRPPRPLTLEELGFLVEAYTPRLATPSNQERELQ